MHVCRFTALSIHTTTTPPPSLILPPIIPRVRQNSFEECKCNPDTRTHIQVFMSVWVHTDGAAVAVSGESVSTTWHWSERVFRGFDFWSYRRANKGRGSRERAENWWSWQKNRKGGSGPEMGSKKKKKVTFIIRNTLWKPDSKRSEPRREGQCKLSFSKDRRAASFTLHTCVTLWSSGCLGGRHPLVTLSK